VIGLVLGSPLWALTLAVLLLGACAHAHTPATQPTGASWRTLRAEHQVAIDVTLASGAHERRTLRGLIAVERPDRFRLRALGPGGITLFELLSVAGRVSVLRALRDPSSPTLSRILESLAGDLGAAYDLEPRPAGRAIEHNGDAMVVREPGRTVRVTPEAIEIDNPANQYRVNVRVTSVETDVALDPAMFVQ
jgi:hypothetical protein